MAKSALYIPAEIQRIENRLSLYPRLRFMGSKYRIAPELFRVFSTLSFHTALDAFSGSGVVAYLLKLMGKQVTANDFLNFAATVGRAVIENAQETLSEQDVQLLLGANKDGRDFIQRTFTGLYFTEEDLRFLDAAWSHIDTLGSFKRDLALSALCLAAVRKQPRGVFTVTNLRYDDGRRTLRAPLRELFVEAVAAYNTAVFDNGQENRVICKDIFEVDPDGYDLVYLDPPYAPPKDDNDYIKRYHFLEGLSVYWQDMRILHNTATKKIEKKYTPFAYKRTIREALRGLIHRFRRSIIILSYSSNSVPGLDEILDMMRGEKDEVHVHELPYRYSFGTHRAASRRTAKEYIFVAW